MTWKIEAIMNFYVDNIQKNHSIKNIMERIRENERIGDICSQAIELTCRENCGLIMPIDMCIDWVKSGGIIDYDGHGYLLDENGEKIGGMHCNTDFLKKAKEEGACFVAWYNK